MRNVSLIVKKVVIDWNWDGRLMVSLLDEAEYLRLEAAVETMERLIGVESVALDSTSMLVAEFVRNARGRMVELEESGAVSGDQDRKKAADRIAGTIAVLMERESRLSTAEREQYGQFLEKDYFTRSDFGPLDQFYGSAWDRLSEEGKDKMSSRVWGGIRKGEYEFTDLPENVRKKESERIYEFLMNPESMPDSYREIPDEDRKEFIREFEAGNHDAADEVLNREGFAENVSVRQDRPTSEKLTDKFTELKVSKVVKNGGDATPEVQVRASSQEVEFDLEGLESVKVAEAASPNPSTIPDVSNSQLERG